MAVYGYARVSSKDQNDARQLLALEQFGLDKEHIFVDRQSGKDFERTGYRKLLRRLKRGDLLVVKSIDRLGRNYREIQEEWQYITRDKESDIVILDMPLLDTRQSRDLIGTLISDIVLQLLSYVAQSERETILVRQAEGIAAAQERGTKFGRPERRLPEGFIRHYTRWRKGLCTAQDICEEYGFSKSTFYRYVNLMQQLCRANPMLKYEIYARVYDLPPVEDGQTPPLQIIPTI